MTFFDWISPLVSFGQLAAGDEGIHVVPGRGMTGADVKRLLEFNGVRVGNTPVYADGGWILTVDDKAKAERVLRQNGM